MGVEGQTIGRYRIIERVGRGGMGVLYRAFDPMLDREVAIKIMAADFDSADNADEARARFFREARAAGRLQHRNIVTIFEFAEDAGTPYTVMEFLRGQNLAERISTGRPFSLAEKLDIVSELCAGLQFAHDNGIVHRDVKPSNVWLLDDGSVKLVDFGIAKLLSSTMTRQGDVLGSAYYMAPEQVLGSAVDGRADIFSATVVLYELLAGRRPFEAESPTSTLLKILQEAPHPLESIAPDLPGALVAAVTKGLQKDVKDRYQSASDLGADLQLVRMSIITDETTSSPGVAWDETIQPVARTANLVGDAPLRWDDVVMEPVHDVEPTASRSRAWVWPSVAMTVVALVAAAAWWTVAGPPRPNPRPRPPVVDVDTAKTDGKQAAPPSLTVHSDPDGADIEIDGIKTGRKTPAELPLGAQPPKHVRLVKKGYQPLDEDLTPVQAAGGVLKYQLIAELPTVKLTATGSYPFSVFDGRQEIRKANTSHEVTVQIGHSLRLVADEYLLDYPVKIDTPQARSVTRSVPELGDLSVRSPSRETCEVSANGKKLGNPPIRRPVAAGRYRIALTCGPQDGESPPSRVETVEPGQNRVVLFP